MIIGFVICIVIGVIALGCEGLNIILMIKMRIVNGQSISFSFFLAGLFVLAMYGVYYFGGVPTDTRWLIASVIVTIGGLLGATFIKQPEKEVDKDKRVWNKRHDGGPGFSETIKKEK